MNFIAEKFKDKNYLIDAYLDFLAAHEKIFRTSLEKILTDLPRSSAGKLAAVHADVSADIYIIEQAIDKLIIAPGDTSIFDYLPLVMGKSLAQKSSLYSRYSKSLYFKMANKIERSPYSYKDRGTERYLDFIFKYGPDDDTALFLELTRFVNRAELSSLDVIKIAQNLPSARVINVDWKDDMRTLLEVVARRSGSRYRSDGGTMEKFVQFALLHTAIHKIHYVDFSQGDSVGMQLKALNIEIESLIKNFYGYNLVNMNDWSRIQIFLLYKFKEISSIMERAQAHPSSMKPAQAHRSSDLSLTKVTKEGIADFLGVKFFKSFFDVFR